MNSQETIVGTVPDYRARIYNHYLQARQQSLAPGSVNEFAPRASYLTKLLRDHFPTNRNAAILDLGCGHGALCYFAHLAGYLNVVGIDRSPAQVAAAQRLSIGGVKKGDLLETVRLLPNHSQDVVVAFDVIEHFTKEELIACVDHIYRVLRPGGKWIIHTPNGESPFAGRVRYGDFTHELAFTQVSLTQLLLASGFAHVSCYEDIPIPHGVKSAFRWLLWKAIRGGLRLYLAAETGASGIGGIFSQNFLAVAIK